MDDFSDPLDFDDNDLRAMTAHERSVCEEIKDWRSTDGALSSIRKRIEDTVSSAVSRVTPEEVRSAVTAALEGSVDVVRDGSRMTFRAESILKKARSQGIEAQAVSDLADASMEKVGTLSKRYFLSNKLAAGTEGGVCGFFGPWSAAVDLPLMFGVAFRGVQQVGTCYGFEMDDPDLRPVVLSVFNVGAGASSVAKTRLLVDVHIAAEAFARRWTYRKVAERTATGTAAQTLKQMTKGLPKKIANKVTKQKLAQSLPFIGSVIGACVNYGFVGRTLRAARMTFRSLFLTRRYGPAKLAS
jgi:hypothetical protein